MSLCCNVNRFRLSCLIVEKLDYLLAVAVGQGVRHLTDVQSGLGLAEPGQKR